MKYFLSLLIVLQASVSFASFDQNSRRYMSYYDLIFSMKSIFLGSDGIPQSRLETDCLQVTDDNKADLGYNNPATGDAITSSPNSSYVRWIGRCVSTYMNYLSTQNVSTLKILSPKAKEFLAKGQMIAVYDFKSLPEDIKAELVYYAFYVVFGPDEAFNQFGLMDAKVYRAKVRAHLEQSNPSLSKALEVIMLNYLLRDEFLSY